MHPSGTGGVYANFPDTDLPDESPTALVERRDRIGGLIHEYRTAA